MEQERARRHVAASRLCLLILLGLVSLLIVSAYFPFAWDPPRVVRNDVTRSPEGFLRFGEMNAARTPGTPAWLDDLRTSGIAQFHLEIKPQSPQQNSPASIMMLASDYWNADIAIEQNRADLFIWLRRAGSDANGDPPFNVRGVFRSRYWTSVDVKLQPGIMHVAVDGTSRATEHFPPGSLRLWTSGQIALGDEVHGGRPWLGEIGHAEVRTPKYAVDYVRPGTLSIPEHFLYFPDHVESFPPSGLKSWLGVIFHLLSFVPVGFLIVWARRPPMGIARATLLAVALAVLLSAGKFLFHGRHAAVADIVEQTAGAFLGAFLASAVSTRQVLPGAQDH